MVGMVELAAGMQDLPKMLDWRLQPQRDVLQPDLGAAF